MCGNQKRSRNSCKLKVSLWLQLRFWPLIIITITLVETNKWRKCILILRSSEEKMIKLLEKLSESKTSKSSKSTAFQSCVTILLATPVGPNVTSSPQLLAHKKVSSILSSMLLVSKSLRIATEDASLGIPFLSVELADLWKEMQNKCAMQCN